MKKPSPPPGPYPTPKNWTLTVGPDPCKVTESGTDVPVAVIYRGTHWIRYKSDAGELMGITFHVPAGGGKPFKNMTYIGTDPDGLDMWALVCDQPNNGCYSGPALKTSASGYHKTDQVLKGSAPCDAGIIIQP